MAPKAKDATVREGVLAKYEEEVFIRGPPDLRIRIRELPLADGVHGSTGNQIWTSSVVLAEELLRRPALVRDKKVIEVGAGCGILGITAATLARRTLLTDGDEEVVRNLEHNVSVNKKCWHAKDGDLPRELRTRRLDWNNEQDFEQWPLEDKADIILASDIIYGHWGKRVACAMINILAPEGMILMAASEDRREGTIGFKDHLVDANFTITETKLTSMHGRFRTYECKPRVKSGTASYFFQEREDPFPEFVENLKRELSVPALATPQQRNGGTTAASPASKVRDAIAEKLPSQTRKEHLEKAIPAIQSAAHAGAGQRDVRTPPKEEPLPIMWEVVGGLKSGGILVRLGAKLDADFLPEKLAHGALVEETGRTASRLHYKKLQGEGPEAGWVSFHAKGGGMMIVKRVL